MNQYTRRERATRILAGLLANPDIDPGLVNVNAPPDEMEAAKIRVLVRSALTYVEVLEEWTPEPPPELAVGPMDDETRVAFDELEKRVVFDPPKDLLDPKEAGGGLAGMRGYGTLTDAGDKDLTREELEGADGS